MLKSQCKFHIQLLASPMCVENYRPPAAALPRSVRASQIADARPGRKNDYSNNMENILSRRMHELPPPAMQFVCSHLVTPSCHIKGKIDFRLLCTHIAKSHRSSGQLWKVRLVFDFCPTRLSRWCGNSNI
jgi:hypothetical protein